MGVGNMGYGSGASGSFTVALTLTVADARALWSAAADRALAAPGMTLADVLDTIGPREDPSIADCIALLTGPAAISRTASRRRRSSSCPRRPCCAPRTPDFSRFGNKDRVVRGPVFLCAWSSPLGEDQPWARTWRVGGSAPGIGAWRQLIERAWRWARSKARCRTPWPGHKKGRPGGGEPGRPI
jgi:hypothetical protein